MEKLKPCPFCGAEDSAELCVFDMQCKIREHADSGIVEYPGISYMIYCRECGTTILTDPEKTDTQAKITACSAWNNRAHVRGEWVKITLKLKNEWTYTEHYCSICRTHALYNMECNEELSHYCPCCGAEMNTETELPF